MSDFKTIDDWSAYRARENIGSSDEEGPDPSGCAESGSEGDDPVQALSREDKEAEIEKGKAVQDQQRQGVPDKLLEFGIGLEQVLIHLMNTLPYPEQFQRLAGTVMTEDLSEIDKAKLTATNLMENIMALKEHMIENYPETSTLGKEKTTTKREVEGDEEITSSEDEETTKTEKDEIVKENTLRARLPKRRKLEFK